MGFTQWGGCGHPQQELPVILDDHFVTEEEDSNGHSDDDEEEDSVSTTVTQQLPMHQQQDDFSFANHNQCRCAHDLMSLCDSIGDPHHFCDGMLALLQKQKKKCNFTPEQAHTRDTLLEVL